MIAGPDYLQLRARSLHHSTMDHLITFEEVTGFLKNLPLLALRPDLARIRTLCNQIILALKQHVCPQSMIHGWSGLIIDPAMYTLLNPSSIVFQPHHLSQQFPHLVIGHGIVGRIFPIMARLAKVRRWSKR
jgi:hypothetical protein